MSLYPLKVALVWLLLIAAVSTLGWLVAYGFAEMWRRFKRLKPASKAMAAVFFAGFTFYAGGKHIIGTITFPWTDISTRYLVNDGSFVTNDYVYVSFTRNPIVPASAWFFLDACPLSVTNLTEVSENSFTVYSNKFADISVPFDVPYTAATNYNWFAYTDWSPSPTVHTNGVAFVLWRFKSTNNIEAVVMPYRTGIYTIGRVAPTPAITNGPPISRGSLLSSPIPEPDTEDTP